MTSCGGTDGEAVEFRMKQKERASSSISQTSFKSVGGLSSIERIELAQIPGQTLGISIKGGNDHPFLVSKDKEVDTGIFVIHIYDGGLAAKDGRLKLGDRILVVNGEDVENVKQKDFLKILGKGSKLSKNLQLTVKHNETLRRRLSSRQTTLPKPTPKVDAESTSGASSDSLTLNAVQMLTGNDVGGHFEPLQACANQNFLDRGPLPREPLGGGTLSDELRESVFSAGCKEKEAILGIEAPANKLDSVKESKVPSLTAEMLDRESESLEEFPDSGLLMRKLLLPTTAAIVVALAVALYQRRNA